jgi:hypothetical protein
MLIRSCLHRAFQTIMIHNLTAPRRNRAQFGPETAALALRHKAAARPRQAAPRKRDCALETITAGCDGTMTCRRFAARYSAAQRRGGRAVEGARLESVCTGNRTEGSNPSLSASASASPCLCSPCPDDLDLLTAECAPQKRWRRHSYLLRTALTAGSARAGNAPCARKA